VLDNSDDEPQKRKTTSDITKKVKFSQSDGSADSEPAEFFDCISNSVIKSDKKPSGDKVEALNFNEFKPFLKLSTDSNKNNSNYKIDELE